MTRLADAWRVAEAGTATHLVSQVLWVSAEKEVQRIEDLLRQAKEVHEAKKRELRKLPCWSTSKRSRDLSPTGVRNLHTTKVENRADFVSFATKYPGRLAAHFLIAAHTQLSKGEPRTRKEMMKRRKC